MKSISLENFNVSELSIQDKKEINGGVHPAVIAGAKIVAAGGVFAAGVVVGAVAVYGAYRLVKWMAS